MLKVILSPTQQQSCADPEGVRGPDPAPEKSESYKCFQAILVLIPKITKLPSQIQCWAIMDPPAKHHLNGASLVGR